jgi:hypothetical protein
MLVGFAERLAASGWRRHAFFFAVTLFAVVFVGYHFGTFDQTIHIPFLKKYADPSLYPGDPFFELRFQHYSFFWFLFLPAYRAGVLPETLLVVHGLATYLTFWMLWRLSETLFGSPLAALFSTLAFAIPHIGFAGFPIIEFSLLNRTFVLPFLLLAIGLFLRGRYWLSFGVLGVMYNLHVISVQFVLAMFMLHAALAWRAIGLRALAVGLGLFAAGAAPVLIWKLTGTPVDFTPRPDWMAIVSRGTLYNLFHLLPPYPHILIMTFSGVSALLLFAIGRQAGPQGPHDRTVTHFVAAALLILGAQVITAEWLPLTIVIQSQIIRIGLFVLIFGYLYFGRYLAEVYQRRRMAPADFGLLLGSYVLVTLPFAPLLVWMVQRLVAAATWRRVVAGASAAAVLAGQFVAVFMFEAWKPGVYPYGPATAWEDAQVWARENTPRDTVFITPPQVFWLYDTDWRVFAERSTVVTLSELLEAAFVPEYIAYWQPRFEALAPGALAQFQGNIMENQALTARAFYAHSAEDFERLGQEFGAAYLVAEAAHPYDLPVAYENEGYRIYRLGGEAMGH